METFRTAQDIRPTNDFLTYKGKSISNNHALRLLLFGPPRIYIKDVLHHFKRRKSYGLIAYLAVNQQAYSREYLASLLWPEVSDKKASQSLRNVLTDIRSTLADDFLYTEGDLIILADDLNVDVADFEIATELFYSQHHQANLSAAMVGQLTNAVQLYTDQFMAGFNMRDSVEFDDWQYIMVQRFQNAVLGMCTTLANHFLIEKQAQQAYTTINRWLDIDPLAEEAHQLLMRLYMQNNQLDRALHQYHMLVRLLHQQDNTEPLAATQHLYEQIRSGQF